MIIWWEELSYPFEDLRGTHAATRDPVVLVVTVYDLELKILSFLKPPKK